MRCALLIACLLWSCVASAQTLWFVPRASNVSQQGFIRVTNSSGTSTEVSLYGIDDTGARSAGTASFMLGPYETKHFNSPDIENGALAKGLTGSIGVGNGNWRVVLTSVQVLEATALIRTPSGFLTSVQDVDPKKVELSTYHVLPTVNPGENQSQVSVLRLVNPTAAPVDIHIYGVDDLGSRRPQAGYISRSLAPHAAINLTAADLEAGNGLSSGLGNGTGKWRLSVFSTHPIKILNLLFDPMGYITELPSEGAEPRDTGYFTCADIAGAMVFSQEADPVYLGFLGGQYATGSINNQYGSYGSPYSSTSVRNSYSSYGSNYGSYSATNPYAPNPPVLVKGGVRVGYLSANSSILGSVSLGMIDAGCAFQDSQRTSF